MFFAQIERLCRENNIKLTTLTSELGYSTGNIGKWRGGAVPNGSVLLKFAEYFKVTTDYLLKGDIVDEVDEDDNDDDDEFINIKVYDEPASAGFGAYLSNDEPYEMIKYPAYKVPRRANCGIRIKGESMEPRISNGEIVFVEYMPKVENGEIGVFEYEGESFCKRVHVDRKKRKVWLVSENDEYPPKLIERPQDLHTIGKVLI